jgi:hypothetical protein
LNTAGPPARSRRDGAAIGDLALAVGLAARIVVDIEFKLVGGNVQAGLFRNPSQELLEHRLQNFFVEMILIARRKIQVFCKPIPLEATPLQTSAEGRWCGRGAELLGLEAEVTSEDFEALRQGPDPV